MEEEYKETVIDLRAKKLLCIDLEMYALADYISFYATKSPGGWAHINLISAAHFFGWTGRGIESIFESLLDEKIIEMRLPDPALRITQKWLDAHSQTYFQ